MSQAVAERERGVYAIYDRGRLPDDSLERAAAALAGGARWLQYRDKRAEGPSEALAENLRRLTQDAGARLIINDDWSLAQRVQADGVHLGRGDDSILRARAALGPKALIGASCSANLDYAEQALSQGASYISFGRFFPSNTKPDAPPAQLSVLRAARRTFDAPIVAIGGIGAGNAARVIEAGADMIAVAAGAFEGGNTERATRALAALFE